MGVHVGEHVISLDMKEDGASLNFVSHAHSDHTGGVKKGNAILCSSITRDLIEARIKFRLNLAEKPKSVELISSGHMLGSSQLYVEMEDGTSLVYTGDYQMQRSPAAEKIEVRSADILIMDSTYPFPNVTFEEKEEVMTSIQHYISKKRGTGSVLFGAYSMGKAQELIRICNDIGISPIVDSSIEKISRIYSRHGVELDFRPSAVEERIERDYFEADAWIVSMGRLDKVRRMVSESGRRIFTAVATGFARSRRFSTDVQFAMSDHADFRQAIEYLEICNPKQIFTRGSESAVFAKNLRSFGYNAMELRPDIGLNRFIETYA